MMLSRKFDEKRVKYPSYVSEKLDGVPVVVGFFDGKVRAISRQGNEITSVSHILKEIEHLVKARPEMEWVGELYIPYTPFKDISGKVRKQNVTSEDLELHLFDCFDRRDELMKYSTRLGLLKNLKSTFLKPTSKIKIITTHYCEDVYEIMNTYTMYTASEGIMIRSAEGIYEKGKRSWDMMKLKPEPTVDLVVVGVNQAVDKYGKLKGMIGSFICNYKGKYINVGAGKLTRDERIQAWAEQPIGKVIEVKYMPDDSYESLRQPVFMRWREDKRVASYE